MDEIICTYEHYHGSSAYDDDEYCKWNDNLDAYHCTICPATMNSEQSFYMHRGGQKHQKKLATMKLLYPKLKKEHESVNQKEISGRGLRMLKGLRTKKVKKIPKIQKYLQKTKDALVGLNHVVEIQLLDHTRCYKCNLCSVKCQSDSIEDHIVGFEHRMNYLKRKLPSIFHEINNNICDRDTKHELAKMHSKRLEKRLGRGQISVEVEVKSKKREITKGGTDENGKIQNISIEEDFDIIPESVKTFEKSEKLDTILFACENLLEQELTNQEFSSEDISSLQEACEKLRNQFIEKELDNMNRDQINVLTDNIKMIRDGNDASVHDIFQMPMTKVGEAMTEILRDLDERGDM